MHFSNPSNGIVLTTESLLFVLYVFFPGNVHRESSTSITRKNSMLTLSSHQKVFMFIIRSNETSSPHLRLLSSCLSCFSCFQKMKKYLWRVGHLQCPSTCGQHIMPAAECQCTCRIPDMAGRAPGHVKTPSHKQQAGMTWLLIGSGWWF